MDVRPAREGDLAAVMTVFDAGGLEVATERVRAGLDDDRVLVAVDDERRLGALLLEPADELGAAEIEAVAVRPGRRGQGLGTALVRAAADRHDRLVAGFDERVRPFWVSLGFDIAPGEQPGRFLGRLVGPPAGE